MRTLIRGVRVFDGVTTAACADVVIDGDRIAVDPIVRAGAGGDATGPSGPGVGGPGGAAGGAVGGAGGAAGPDAADLRASCDVVVDGTGRTLLPGLVDAHTHVFDGSLARALEFGVTTELDMFCLPGNLARQRELAATHDGVADLRSAGVLATAPGGHPSQLMPALAESDAVGPFDTVAGVGDVRRFVEARVAEGVDYLKVVVDSGAVHGTSLPVLAPEVVAALVEVGHEHGLAVIAHAITAAEVGIALDAGVDGLAHVWCDATPDGLAERVAAQGVFVVGTLAYFEAITGGARTADHAVAGSLDGAMAATRALLRAGAPILAGTDATPFVPGHGDGMHRELELLVRAGLTARQALAAATSAPARHFGLTDRGRIASGLRADLVLVEGDPTRDITTTAAIVDVWRRGVRQVR
ncbi:amidohydrolase family protein [Saccharothrix australiensis]|uniref:Imidazolonepropionase-like amidohydrolase n=1 Tax=Saccharothrix australiensis TaxID=2072 RepID=A0A495VZE3_9PSEU|nr:amidohydrolase family protein [Saccharothrix australiensis]RKT53893.1 imidazolonepropionase-like amidohydrolase [Saccharothrix australiensis]